MAYYDITGSIEIKSSSSKDDITGELVRSFRARKFETRARRNLSENHIRIKSPFWLAAMKRANLRRISDGRISIKQQEPEHYLLEYHLSIFPIRVLYAIAVLFNLIFIPTLWYFRGEPIRFSSYMFSDFLIFPAIFFLVYFVESFWTKSLFKRFIKTSLKEKTESIKHASLKTNYDTKVIFATSCSGVLLLIFLFFGFFAAKIMFTRSKLLWHTPIEGIVVSAPEIEKNIVYFGTMQTTKEEEETTFYAIDAESGHEIWSVPVDGNVTKSPLIADSSVLFSTMEGSFYALNIKNGQENWRFTPEKRNLNPDTCETCVLQFDSPIAEDNIVYASSRDHSLYAFDLKTGNLIWYFLTGDDITASPTISNDRIYIASLDGYIYELDAETGVELRRYNIPPQEAPFFLDFFSSPLVEANSIYIANKSLMALDIETGNLKWRFSLPVPDDPIEYSEIIGNPIIFDNLIILITRNKIYGIDKNTGDAQWDFSKIKESIYFAPVLSGSILYFGDSEFQLYMIDAKTGRLINKYNMKYFKTLNPLGFQEPSFPLFPPSVEDGIIYIGWDQGLYALEGDN